MATPYLILFGRDLIHDFKFVFNRMLPLIFHTAYASEICISIYLCKITTVKRKQTIIELKIDLFNSPW